VFRRRRVRSPPRPPGRPAAALASLLLSCAAVAAPDRTLTVDATATASRAAGFRLHAHNPNRDESSLRFQETARQLKTVLSAHGFYEAPDDRSADFVVELDFGVQPGTPKFKQRYAPIYAQDHRLHLPVPDPNGWAGIGRHPPGTLEDGSHLVDYSVAYFPVPTTEKFLAISARENRPVARRSRSGGWW
jgi:hypothetical protein